MITVEQLKNYKLERYDVTGPAAAVTVAAGTASTITIAITKRNITHVKYRVILGIWGIPDGLALVGFRISGDNIEIRVYNPTAAGITVAINALTITIGVTGI